MEFGLKGPGRMEVHLRCGRGSPACTFLTEASQETRTCLVRVNSVVADLWVNGKMEIETVVDVKPGPPMLGARNADRLLVSGIRFRLLKTAP